jgi:hypothetical protein
MRFRCTVPSWFRQAPPCSSFTATSPSRGARQSSTANIPRNTSYTKRSKSLTASATGSNFAFTSSPARIRASAGNGSAIISVRASPSRNRGSGRWESVCRLRSVISEPSIHRRRGQSRSGRSRQDHRQAVSMFQPDDRPGQGKGGCLNEQRVEG